MFETMLTPIGRCICPSANYTCLATSATGISWKTVGEPDFKHTRSNPDVEYFEGGGYQVTFRSEPEDSFSSSLHISDLGLNGTNLTCEGFVDVVGGGDNLRLTNTTTVICVVGMQCLGFYLPIMYH